jgi:hypothetical protein
MIVRAGAMPPSQNNQAPQKFQEIRMAPSAPQIFKGISPAQYERLVAKAETAGIALNGNSGTASKYGVEISWNYQPEIQELSLQCLKTPFFVNAADVNSKIQTLVKEFQAAG